MGCRVWVLWATKIRFFFIKNFLSEIQIFWTPIRNKENDQIFKYKCSLKNFSFHKISKF
jgi:hypothetical protein